MIYFYVKVAGDITKMRFQVYVPHLCFLVLVALTCHSQAQLAATTTEQPTFLQKIHDTFKKVEETTKMKLHNFHIFDPPWIYTTTTTTTEKPGEEELAESFKLDNRQLITVPVRCPPNHDFIRGRCREKIP